VGGGHGVVTLTHLVREPVHLGLGRVGGGGGGRRKVGFVELVRVERGGACLPQTRGRSNPAATPRQPNQPQQRPPAPPAHLAAGVGEDHALRDGQGLVQVAQSVQLPVLLLDVHIELLDALKRQLVALHENAHRLVHELARDLQRLRGQGGGEDAHLQLGGQQLEDVVDLVLEPAGEHLVGLIQHKHLDAVGAQAAAAEHVVHAAGGADDLLGAGWGGEGEEGGSILHAGLHSAAPLCAAAAAAAAAAPSRHRPGCCPTPNQATHHVDTGGQDASVLAHAGATHASVALDLSLQWWQGGGEGFGWLIAAMRCCMSCNAMLHMLRWAACAAAAAPSSHHASASFQLRLQPPVNV